MFSYGVAIHSLIYKNPQSGIRIIFDLIKEVVWETFGEPNEGHLIGAF